MSEELKQRARQAIGQLAALDESKKPGSGLHDQVDGMEPWLISATGNQLRCLLDAQYLLHEVLDPFERRAPPFASHARGADEQAAFGSMDEFAEAAELVGVVMKAKTNGEALGAILKYRKKVRAAALASTHAAGETDEHDESAGDAWRRLALQFDGHRMQALAHLRALLADHAAHATIAAGFLEAPPLDGEQVLAERLAAIAPARAAGGTLDEAVAFIVGYCEHDPMPPAIDRLVQRLRAIAQPAVGEPSELIAKLERVSKWIDQFPVPTDSAAAMVRHLRDVKEAITSAGAANQVAREVLHPMAEEDGTVRQWFFDCDGHYIDVARDEHGKFSILFKDRKDMQGGWLDQADASTDVATRACADGRRTGLIEQVHAMVENREPGAASVLALSASAALSRTASTKASAGELGESGKAQAAREVAVTSDGKHTAAMPPESASDH